MTYQKKLRYNMVESPPSRTPIETIPVNQREQDKRDLFAYNYGLSKQVFMQILNKMSLQFLQ